MTVPVVAPARELAPSALHELLGWKVWVAHGRRAVVRVAWADDHLDVLLAQEPVPGPGAGPCSTMLVLGDDGHCTATHVASPSLLHMRREAAMAVAADRDGPRSDLAVASGDVLLAATAAFVQAAPAELLAQIQQRTQQPQTLAWLARDLLSRVARRPGGQHAALVVAQRAPNTGV